MPLLRQLRRSDGAAFEQVATEDLQRAREVVAALPTPVSAWTRWSPVQPAHDAWQFSGGWMRGFLASASRGADRRPDQPRLAGLIEEILADGAATGDSSARITRFLLAAVGSARQPTSQVVSPEPTAGQTDVEVVVSRRPGGRLGAR